mgnify:CR=1 FL=1
MRENLNLSFLKKFEPLQKVVKKIFKKMHQSELLTHLELLKAHQSVLFARSVLFN